MCAFVWEDLIGKVVQTAGTFGSADNEDKAVETED
jgi:hypothetical protein